MRVKGQLDSSGSSNELIQVTLGRSYQTVKREARKGCWKGGRKNGRKERRRKKEGRKDVVIKCFSLFLPLVFSKIFYLPPIPSCFPSQPPHNDASKLTLKTLPIMTSMSLIIFSLGYYTPVSNLSAFSLTPSPPNHPMVPQIHTHTQNYFENSKKKKSHPRSVRRLPFLQDWIHVSKGAKQDV